MTNVQLYQQIYIKMLPIASDIFDLVKYTELVDKTYDECAKRCEMIKQKYIDSQTTDEDIEKDLNTIKTDRCIITPKPDRFAPTPFIVVKEYFQTLSNNVYFPLKTDEIKKYLQIYCEVSNHSSQVEIIKVAKNKGILILDHKEGRIHFWKLNRQIIKSPID